MSNLINQEAVINEIIACLEMAAWDDNPGGPPDQHDHDNLAIARKAYDKARNSGGGINDVAKIP